MSTSTPSRSDLPAGLALVAFGLAGVWLSLDMRLGTAIAMGPGYFPLLVHAGIIVLGLVIALRGVRGARTAPARVLWRPLLVISAALLAFWLLIERAGFVVAALALMLIAIRAQDRLGWRRALVFSGAAVAVAALIFVVGLSLPFPMWPQWSR